MSKAKTRAQEPAESLAESLFAGAGERQEGPSAEALSQDPAGQDTSQAAPAAARKHPRKKTGAAEPVPEPKRDLVAHKPKADLPARRDAGKVVRSSAGEIMNAVTQAATNPAVDVGKMEKLLAVLKELQLDEQRRAYDRSLAEMQPHLPIIDRKGRIVVREKDRATGERTGKIQQDTPYAKWEDINEQLTPVLAHYGFAQSFRVDGGAGSLVVVTCILSHEDGHREQTTISLPHDSSGSKNSVQAVGSSISYGKRYTSGLLLNFTTRGEDDDAKKTGGPKVVGEPITAEELSQLRDQCIAEELKPDALVKYLNKTRPADHPELDDLENMPRARWDEAQKGITAWREEQKRRKTEPKKEGVK